MLIDLLFDPFGVYWDDVRAGAIAAEQAGFDGVWLYDHLAGSVHREQTVVECWTTLTAIAAVVPRVNVGSMVLNVANRDPETLAVMAATLQDVSGGRLLLGLGAGGGRDTPYATEQYALGRAVAGDRERRANVERAVAQLRRVWTGEVGGVGGFPQPDPPPPVIIGGFGPKMAELAGRVGDGMNAPGGAQLPSLTKIAREAHARTGHDPDDFVVTASAGASARERDRLEGLGVARMVVFVPPPFVDGIERAHAALLRRYSLVIGTRIADDGGMATTRRADMFIDLDDDPRENRPRLGDERSTLVESLRCLRLTLEMKCAGLDAEAMARRAVEPSTMSLLGIVRHLAEVERAGFREMMAGQDAPRLYCSATNRDGDFDGAVPDPEVVAQAWAAWRAEVEFTDQFVADAPSLDVTGDDPLNQHGSGGGAMSLREMLVGTIEEYARHLGHVDLLRERIDGRLGQ